MTNYRSGTYSIPDSVYAPELNGEGFAHVCCIHRSRRIIKYHLVGQIFMKLDYIVLHVGDVETTRDWYCDHLNLSAEWDTEEFVLLSGENGARLGLHRGSPLSDPESVHLHFEVDDVDKTYEQLRETGLTFTAPPTDTEWGYRTVVSQDPVGHTVELFTPNHS